jgi:hypothetical protein
MDKLTKAPCIIGDNGRLWIPSNETRVKLQLDKDIEYALLLGPQSYQPGQLMSIGYAVEIMCWLLERPNDKHYEPWHISINAQVFILLFNRLRKDSRFKNTTCGPYFWGHSHVADDGYTVSPDPVPMHSADTRSPSDRTVIMSITRNNAIIRLNPSYRRVDEDVDIRQRLAVVLQHNTALIDEIIRLRRSNNDLNHTVQYLTDQCSNNNPCSGLIKPHSPKANNSSVI